jgi:hypothetical protein
MASINVGTTSRYRVWVRALLSAMENRPFKRSSEVFSEWPYLKHFADSVPHKAHYDNYSGVQTVLLQDSAEPGSCGPDHCGVGETPPPQAAIPGYRTKTRQGGAAGSAGHALTTCDARPRRSRRPARGSRAARDRVSFGQDPPRRKGERLSNTPSPLQEAVVGGRRPFLISSVDRILGCPRSWASGHRYRCNLRHYPWRVRTRSTPMDWRFRSTGTTPALVAGIGPAP